MRIRQLNLIAFGHFDRETIPLNPENTGIDLIYGPNEAGKSTTLRAVQSLLFGFEHKVTDAFRHLDRKLRVGATLEFHDGKAQSVIRRRGRKNTLRAANDRDVINEGTLARVLRPLSSESSRSRFLINGDELTRGGEAIVRNQGDQAEALFAAASGGRQLDALQTTLRDQAEKLFKPRAQGGENSPKVNQQSAEEKKLASQIKQAALAPADWLDTRDRFDDAERRIEQLEAKVRQLDAEISQLERYRNALPAITRRREAQRELAELRDVPPLADDFSQRRQEVEISLTRLNQQIKDAKHDLEKRRRQIEECDVSDELLANQTTIRELRDDAQRIRELRRGLDERQRQIDQQRERTSAILRELQWTESDQLPDTWRPSASLERRLDKLRDKFTTLTQRRIDLRDEDGEAGENFRTAQEALANAPEPQDCSELSRAVKSARLEGRLEDQRDTVRSEAEQHQTVVQQELSGLPLWTGSIDELDSLTVPLSETVRKFETDFQNRHATRDAVQRTLQELGDELQSVRDELEQLSADREVPTEESLSSSRELRDRGWRLITRRIAAATADRAGNAASSGLTEEEGAFVEDVKPSQTEPTLQNLIEAYEETVRNADTISDRLRQESESIAKTLQLQARQEKLLRRQSEQSAQLDELIQGLSELTEQWQSQWPDLPGKPLTPTEMREWLQQRKSILDRHQTAVETQSKLDRWNERIEKHRRNLIQVLSLPADCDLSLADLLVRADEELDQRKSANHRREQLQDNLNKAKALQDRVRRDEETLATDLAEWHSQWEPVLTAIGAPPETEPDAARDRLLLLKEWFETSDSIDERTQQNTKDTEQSEEFDRRVETLLKHLAPELLSSADRTVAIQDLDTRLQEHLNRDAQRNTERAELKKQEERLAAAEQDRATAQATLNALCDEAGTADKDALPEVERRSADKRQAKQRFDAASDDLADFTGGQSLNDFVSAAVAFSQEQLDAEISEHTTRRDELQTELNDLRERRGELKEKLSGWTGESLAAEANEKREAVLAAMRNHAEDYARLTILSEVLKQTGQQYREKHQGPVLGRASELFRELTCGSFTRIETEYDKKGQPVIVGIRAHDDGSGTANPETVEISGMSEGTCDQLYLALRLATLDEYLSQHDPVPLLIDDLLIRFDDARSAAALRVLDEFSQRTQVIVFTHHQHVVDLAEKSLAPNRLHLHRLGSET